MVKCKKYSFLMPQWNWFIQEKVICGYISRFSFYEVSRLRQLPQWNWFIQKKVLSGRETRPLRMVVFMVCVNWKLRLLETCWDIRRLHFLEQINCIEAFETALCDRILEICWDIRRLHFLEQINCIEAFKTAIKKF